MARKKFDTGSRKRFDTEMNKFADGGMMADGGYMALGGYSFREADIEDINWIVQHRENSAFKKAFAPAERIYTDPLNDEELRLYLKAKMDRDDLQDAKAYMKQIMDNSGGMMADGGMISLSKYYKTLPKKELLVGLKVFDKNNEEFVYIKDVESGIFAGKNKNDELGHYYRMYDLMIEEYADGGMMADGGVTAAQQKYIDKSAHLRSKKLSYQMSPFDREVLAAKKMISRGVDEKKLNDKFSFEVISAANSELMYEEFGYTMIDGGYMAKGGMMEHGLKSGDKIIQGKIIGTTIRVRNENSNEDARVDLNTGKRTILDYNKKTKKWEEKMSDGGMMADGLPISEIVDDEIRVYSNNINDILSFVGEGVYDISVESYIPKMSSNYQNEISIYFNENSWGGISKEDWNKAAKILDKYVDKNGFEYYDINPSHNHLQLYFSYNNYPMGDYENKEYADGGMMADGGQLSLAEQGFFDDEPYGYSDKDFNDYAEEKVKSYREELEYLTDDELATELVYETGVSREEALESIEEERIEVISELVSLFINIMKSRGTGFMKTSFQKIFSKSGSRGYYMADGGFMKKGGINKMEKTDNELLTNDELLAGHIEEAKRNKVKITNLGWNQGKDYIVSKTTQRKDGSNILTSFINFNHAWDSY